MQSSYRDKELTEEGGGGGVVAVGKRKHRKNGKNDILAEVKISLSTARLHTFLISFDRRNMKGRERGRVKEREGERERKIMQKRASANIAN